MNPVCTRCQVELRTERNGVVVVVMADFGPLEIRRGDLRRCPSCGYEAVIGLAPEPELRHSDPAFQARLDSYDLDPREQVIRFWQNPTAKERWEHLEERERLREQERQASRQLRHLLNPVAPDGP